MPSLFSLVKGLGLGAGAMYLLDPVAGRRRRSLLRDQAVSLAGELECFVDRGLRDLSNRFQGSLAEMRSMMSRERPSQEVVTRRVRTVMGRYVSHPTAIDVDVADDRVILRGPILASEIRPFVRAVESMRGVMHVENQLDPHTEPDVPALMTEPRQRRTPLTWPNNWSPSTKLLVGASAIGLMTACAVRRNPLAAGAAGMLLGLMTRAAVEQPSPTTGRQRRQPTGRQETAMESAANETEANRASMLGQR